MATPTTNHNPLTAAEALALADRLVAATSIAEEERLAIEVGLTLAEARAVALLVSAERQDRGLRRLLARDSDYCDLFPKIEAKLREYAREDVPALVRLTAREILLLVEDAADRSARITAAAAQLAPRTH